jgi:hypothetical protein
MAGWKLAGISDESTVCEVCGRTELKSTYHLIMEDGSELRAGSSCGARRLGIKAAEITRAAKSYRLRFEIARCNWPDHFRRVWSMSPAEFIRKRDDGRTIAERSYRLFMAREGFTV